MSRGEKLDLRKAIMELPGGNRDRIAGIVQEHCKTSGKDFSDEVIANLDQSVRQNIIQLNRLWSVTVS